MESADVNVLVATATAAADVVGVILVIAGVSKTGKAAAVEAILLGYGGLPKVLARPVALLLGPSEIVMGVGLIVPWTRHAAAVVASSELAAACLVVATSLAIGKVPGTCGCLGVHGGPPTWRTTLRLAGMVMLILPATFVALPLRNLDTEVYLAGLAVVAGVVISIGMNWGAKVATRPTRAGS